MNEPNVLFLFFTGLDYYPTSGLGDCDFVFDTEDAAWEAVKRFESLQGKGEIVSTDWARLYRVSTYERRILWDWSAH